MLVTPKEKLMKANEEYHEAVNDILMDEEIAVEVKCSAAALFNEIFARMEDANTILGIE